MRRLKQRIPKVMLSAEAEQQLRVWTRAAQGEFSCFGVTEWSEDSGVIAVKRFFLPKQECGAAHTAPDKEAMGGLMTDLVKAGLNVADLRCWAHSHADMGTFWSEEDNATINQLDNDDWMLSLVVNKAGVYRARLDLYRPFRMTLDKLEVGFLSDFESSKDLIQELKQKVSFSMWPADHGWPQQDDALVMTELQDCGLTAKEASQLTNVLERWDMVTKDDFEPLMDHLFGDLRDEVDGECVADVLQEYGYLDDRRWA